MQVEDVHHVDSNPVHLMDQDELLQSLNTDMNGITFQEASSRIQIHGPNSIEDNDDESLFKKFLEQFKEPLILLLLSSALVSVLMGEIADAIGIFIAVSIVNFVGFYQEYKSEQSVEALKNLTAHYCPVIRGGSITKILAQDLVPGDIVPIESGARIPADIRLLEASNIFVGKMMKISFDQKIFNKNIFDLFLQIKCSGLLICFFF